MATWGNTGGNLRGPAGSGVTIKGTLSGAATPLPAGAVAGDMHILGDPVPTAAPGITGAGARAAASGDGIVYSGTAWTNVGPIRGPAGTPGAKGDPGPTAVSGDAGNVLALRSGLIYMATEVSATAIESLSETQAPTGKSVSTALGTKADTTYVDSKVVAFAGGISLVGTYDATTGANKVATVSAGTSGITAGQALPAAASTNKGWYLIVTAGGTGSGNAPAETFIPGDWVVSTGSVWTRMDMSAHEKEIYYQATQPTTGTGTLIGQLWIDSDDLSLRVKTGVGAFNYVKAEADTTLSSFATGVSNVKVVAVGGAQPSATGHTKLWVDTATAPAALKYTNGTAWSTATLRGSGWFSGAGEPTNPANTATVAAAQSGDLWLDTTSGNVWRFA